MLSAKERYRLKYEGKCNVCRVCGNPCDYRNNICQTCTTAERTQPLDKRIRDKSLIDPLTGCWNFTGSIINSGYGRISAGKPSKYMTAHRASWEAFKGPIPAGIQVLHHCDNKICVNPDHLFLGNQKDNMQDMLHKGRGNSKGQRPSRWGQKHPMARLTDEQVSKLRLRIGNGENRRLLAKEYGISYIYLNAVCAGRKRKHG